MLRGHELYGSEVIFYMKLMDEDGYLTERLKVSFKWAQGVKHDGKHIAKDDSWLL